MPFILAMLLRMGLLPGWLKVLLPLIVKYGPAAITIIQNLVKLIQDLEKKHGVVVVNNTPNMIPGYGPHGELILIPNPDFKS